MLDKHRDIRYMIELAGHPEIRQALYVGERLAINVA
jgi:hypothetical protein